MHTCEHSKRTGTLQNCDQEGAKETRNCVSAVSSVATTIAPMRLPLNSCRIHTIWVRIVQNCAKEVAIDDPEWCLVIRKRHYQIRHKEGQVTFPNFAKNLPSRIWIALRLSLLPATSKNCARDMSNDASRNNPVADISKLRRGNQQICSRTELEKSAMPPPSCIHEMMYEASGLRPLPSQRRIKISFSNCEHFTES